MTDPIAVAILLGSFIVLILLGVHVAFAIGFASLLTTLYIGISVQTVAQNMVKGINVYALMAVPFFILAGEIMGAGGISRRLIELANALVGWFRGGLAMVNVVASMFFGGISGSAAADTASIGSIMLPMMKKSGYDEKFSAALTVSSSVQGILLPPSHNMIIYAMAAGSISIGALFMAGIVPGVLLGVALMIYSYYIARKHNYPVGEPFNLKTAINAFLKAGLGLGTVLIVVIGVVTGIFTATESAAIAVIYAFIITFFVYREIPLSEMWNILGRSIRTLAIVMILVGTATAFGWLMAYLRIPGMIAETILAISDNKYIILIIINILLLVLGMFMNMVSIIIIMAPILLPITASIGIDPVHFGVIMILNLGIGIITPPVGNVLFIGSAISGIKIETLARSLVPFYILMVIVLLIITFIPEIVMFIPNHFMN
jgi:tripartite ATP-independent transporter DctM subunit